jgi:hypothetical protein
MLTAPARGLGTDFESALGGELVIREAELLAAHHPVSACNHRAIVTRMAWVFQDYLCTKRIKRKELLQQRCNSEKRLLSMC